MFLKLEEIYMYGSKSLELLSGLEDPLESFWWILSIMVKSSMLRRLMKCVLIIDKV